MCTGTRRMMHQCFYIQGEIISTMGWILSRLKQSFTNFIDTSFETSMTMFEVIYITTPCRLVRDSNCFGKTYCLISKVQKTKAAGSSKTMQNSRRSLLLSCTATWHRRSQPQFSSLWYIQISSNIMSSFFAYCPLQGGGETGLWDHIAMCVYVHTCFNFESHHWFPWSLV